MKKLKTQLLNKSKLIEKLAKRKKISLGLATQIFETIFEEIEKALLKGHNVEIRGFGTFSVKHYKGYKGTNPQNKQPIYVKPKKRPVFKPGKIKKILKSS